MNARAQAAEVALPTVAFTLDHQTMHAFEGETILKAAERHGMRIPRLCHQDGLRPDSSWAPAWWKLQVNARWRPAAVAA